MQKDSSEKPKKPTIEQLRAKTGLVKSEFTDLAELSTSTYRRITLKNQNVKQELVQKCLNIINDRLHTSYDIEDIDYYVAEEEEEQQKD